MIFSLLFALPLVLALLVEYGVCRFPKHRFWRWLPPPVTAAAGAVIALYRYHGWSDNGAKAPIEQLLFIPGLPLLGVFLGLWLGWRVWKRLWTPRVVQGGK